MALSTIMGTTASAQSKVMLGPNKSDFWSGVVGLVAGQEDWESMGTA